MGTTFQTKVPARSGYKKAGMGDGFDFCMSDVVYLLFPEFIREPSRRLLRYSTWSTRKTEERSYRKHSLCTRGYIVNAGTRATAECRVSVAQTKLHGR